VSTYPLASWHDAFLRALRERDIPAVASLLVGMAFDGYGHEAEELRREITQSTTELANAKEA